MPTRPDDPSTLRGPDPDDPTTLREGDPVEARAERLAGELADDWHAGRRRGVEEILDRDPEIRDHPHAAVRLIYEEICLRQEDGPGASTVEMLGRFPRYRDELRVLLAGHRLLEDDLAPTGFPRAGQTLGRARLLAELGRGALGRVFLATQPDLADRPVVLKVVPRRGGEHLSLARLQHANVVPLYAVEDFPERGLRSLCMPYHGPMTLARLAEALAALPHAGRTGLDILAALDQAQEGLPVVLPSAGPARDRLARASFDRAVVGIGEDLARALHHAHRRGLIHLDLKPSNILLAADGQPMLLDFHLARKPIHPDDPEPGSIGGTPDYMSPEQAEVLERARAGKCPRSVVDGRSDLYSLGLVLYQTLGGPWPPPPGARRAARALRRANPSASPGLAAVIARCLEPDPRDRYPDALALAEDLRLHLAHRPLRWVANRSPVEAWRKWRRRRPHALALVAMALAVAAVGAVGAYVAWTIQAPPRVIAIEPDPSRTRSIRAEIADQLARDLDEIRRQLDPARRIDPASAHAQAASCREIWDRREQILEAGAGPPSDPSERRIRDALVDLVALSTALETRSDPEDPAATRRQGLRRLDDAATRLGPSPILDRARKELLDRPVLSEDPGLRRPPDPQRAPALPVETKPRGNRPSPTRRSQ